MNEAVTPELLLNAYASGYFPMAESRDATELHWFYPQTRGILPLESFHVPRSLGKLMRKHSYDIRKNTAFEQVMRACAEERPERPESWINEEIIGLYTQLHQFGHAHSIEVWDGDVLIGGLYGVSLAGAFFGESMFSHQSGASKIALTYLVERLKHAGYVLLDAQYSNPHLIQFGVQEIPCKEYLKKLHAALQITPKDF